MQRRMTSAILFSAVTMPSPAVTMPDPFWRHRRPVDLSAPRRRGPIRRHQRVQSSDPTRLFEVQAEQRRLAFVAYKTKGLSDVYVQSNLFPPWSELRLAHASWPQPDHLWLQGRSPPMTATTPTQATSGHPGNGVRLFRWRSCAQPTQRRRRGRHARSSSSSSQQMRCGGSTPRDPGHCPF